MRVTAASSVCIYMASVGLVTHWHAGKVVLRHKQECWRYGVAALECSMYQEFTSNACEGI